MTGQGDRQEPQLEGAKLSIGALSRATDISVETLRTWERRYGYPQPERKASGHRVYAVESVPRLRRIAHALTCGHRAREVVPASDAELAALLRTAPASASVVPVQPVSADIGELLRTVERFDGINLTRLLLAEWARLGPLDFLRGLIAPLVQEVGDRWAKGTLEIRHEHFLSERVGDLLRTVRHPFDERATGPLVVLVTLPGEAHGLGLQMAALIIAAAGCRVCYVGTEVPLDEAVQLASDLGATGLAISVSEASAGRSTAARITRLRRDLPRRTTLLIGGSGAPRASEGVLVFRDLDSLHDWASAQ